MMRRLFRLTVTPATLVGVAVLLVALAAVLPLLGATPAPAAKVALPPGQVAFARIEVADPAHFLGQRFDATLVVQHVRGAIELDAESLRKLSFAPFEATGTVRAATRPVAEGVDEYRHSVEIRGIDVLPGTAYTPEPLEIRYTVKASGRQEVLTVPFEQPLRISSYYGPDADLVPIRPMRSGLRALLVDAGLLAAASGLLFVASALQIGRFLDPRRGSRTPSGEDPELRRVHAVLRRVGQLDWQEDGDPRGRLREIEAIAMHLGSRRLGLTPRQLWLQPGDAWRELREALRNGYAKMAPDQRDVQRASRALAAVFDGHRPPAA